MLETKKPFVAGLVLALLAAAGCYNFDEVFNDCVSAGRCKPTDCDPSASDPPDDLFFDANCDGVDGMADGGVFVDPRDGVDDVTSGTRGTPFKSLSFALQHLPEGNTAIYLAQGAYDEPEMRLDKPVSLYGGYAGVQGNWA
ncbi:MAG: PE-PGRS family protein, partial [Archangium sp.]